MNLIKQIGEMKKRNSIVQLSELNKGTPSEHTYAQSRLMEEIARIKPVQETAKKNFRKSNSSKRESTDSELFLGDENQLFVEVGKRASKIISNSGNQTNEKKSSNALRYSSTLENEKRVSFSKQKGSFRVSGFANNNSPKIRIDASKLSSMSNSANSNNANVQQKHPSKMLGESLLRNDVFGKIMMNKYKRVSTKIIRGPSSLNSSFGEGPVLAKRPQIASKSIQTVEDRSTQVTNDEIADLLQRTLLKDFSMTRYISDLKFQRSLLKQNLVLVERRLKEANHLSKNQSHQPHLQKNKRRVGTLRKEFEGCIRVKSAFAHQRRKVGR